jgi:hypothetical protein
MAFQGWEREGLEEVGVKAGVCSQTTAETGCAWLDAHTTNQPCCNSNRQTQAEQTIPRLPETIPQPDMAA